LHELSLFRDLMRKIDQLAREQGAQRVAAVDVTLGALSHLSPEHFREHFAELSPGTVAEGAELRVTVGDDPRHPLAQEVVLNSLELEVEEP
jgi:hydrogenase nickel incorporation protein HypA/HybF